MDRIRTRRDVRTELAEQGWSLIHPVDVEIPASMSAELERLLPAWRSLPPDTYLAGGGRYRFRRHAAFMFRPGAPRLLRLPPGSYYQAATTNPFAGGVARVFAPIGEELSESAFLHDFMRFNLELLPVVLDEPWRVDVHIVRIVGTESEPGLPTPEGIHNDGFDFVSLHLISRSNVSGGETQVYEGERPCFKRVLTEPLSSVYADDRRLRHFVTPITPASPGVAVRDTLLMSFVRERAHVHAD